MVITNKAEIYGHLDPRHAGRAQNFFAGRSRRSPHLAFMEQRFLEMLDTVAGGRTLSKTPADQIEPVTLGSPYLTSYASFGKREEHYRQLGIEALRRGELAVVDLAGGMATGFGGGAKGSVLAQVDARYEGQRGVTYLDIKRSNYLQFQRESGRHIIAAEMVSGKTIDSIREKLRKFAEDHGVELVIIEDGESRENVQAVWERYKDRWEDSIIVPLLMQPSTLLISKDGRLVGSEYMKGHGDFYDVVKGQLKDIAEIAGIKYIFVSNIDNTGALISRSILGHFIEQVENEKIEALVELAGKFEGDKGGTPSLVRSIFSILEEPFVPDELKDDFLGRMKFPFFNTNSFWFLASPLFSRPFTLPFMIAPNVVREQNADFLKIETILGHGLEQMMSRGLVIDRGLRFNPAKFLSDLWIGRTDCVRQFRGRFTPVMRDGEYIPKPLVEAGRHIFGSVSDIDGRLFGHGSYDSMVDLKTLLIGGMGRRFNDVGQVQTKCGVRYRGDVAVIFEYREGKSSGTLIIEGASEADTITLGDSVIYVPAGSTRVLSKSVVDRVEVAKDDLEAFLANANRWPLAQRQRVLDKMFPEFKITDKIITINDLLAAPQLIDEIHQKQLRVLRKVFIPEGSLVYEVTWEENPTVKGDPEKSALCPDSQWPKLHVFPGSKIGLAVHYPSRGDAAWVWAADHKAKTIIKMPHELFADAIDESKGEMFQGKHYVAIPYGLDGRGRIVMILGHFNEDHDPQEKIADFPFKLNSLLSRFADPNRQMTRENESRIRELFVQIPWADLFELSTQVLFEKYIAGKV